MKLEMDISGFRKTTNTLLDNKVVFDQLEDITLNLIGTKWNSGLTDFLNKHQSIVKFTLNANDNTKDIDNQVLTEILRTLPLLAELNVSGPNYTVDFLVGLINRFHLMKFRFSLEFPAQISAQDRQGHINRPFHDLQIGLGHSARMRGYFDFTRG